MADPPTDGICRVVLLGIMGAGKSAVGSVLARRLGWRHLDLDREIEHRQGRTIADIFSAEGEPYFRALERELTGELAGCDRLVLSPGGGWITNPGVLEALGPATLSVWLRVSPDVVLARLAQTDEIRPLLQTPDPRAEVERLLEAREPLYRRADLAVGTEGRGVEEVAMDIEHQIRIRGVAPLAE